MQKITLAALAEQLGMTLQGEDSPFSGLNTLEEATETEISFLSNPKYAHLLKSTKALAVIVDAEHAGEVKNALVSPNPYMHFAMAASLFLRPPSAYRGISDRAEVHPDAQIGEQCTLYPCCYIGARVKLGKGCTVYPGAFIGDDCVLGENCVLFPNSTVLAGVEIGNNCTIQSGAVIGTEGFGFVLFGGSMQKIPQIGTVRIADDVEVGANACIDRATLSATSVGKETKIDNLVQLGHNVTVGEQCLLISQVGIAGSTKLGNRVTIAGQAGLSGHLHIGNDVQIGPQAGVIQNIPDGVSGSGSPFMDSSIYMRYIALQSKIPAMHKRVQKLEKELDALKTLLGKSDNKENS